MYFTKDPIIVRLSRIEVNTQYFAAVDELSGFNKYDKEGIFGLAFREISAIQQPSVFETAIEEGDVAATSFGMRLTPTGTELYFSGEDQHLYKGKIEEHPVDSSSGYWQIKGASAHLGGNMVVSGFDTIIDTATDFIYGPHKMVRTSSL